MDVEDTVVYKRDDNLYARFETVTNWGIEKNKLKWTPQIERASRGRYHSLAVDGNGKRLSDYLEDNRITEVGIRVETTTKITLLIGKITPEEVNHG